MPSQVDTFFDGFLIDLGSQLRPPEPSKSWFFLWKNEVFSKNCLSKLRMIFDTILVPTWLHFASPNPPKSFQKSIPRCIDFLIDFCIDFCAILAPSWGPSWGHVGDFFGQKWGICGMLPPFLFRWRFFPTFWPSWPPPGPHLGSILAGFRLHFGSILENILAFLGQLFQARRPHKPQTS